MEAAILLRHILLSVGVIELVARSENVDHGVDVQCARIHATKAEKQVLQKTRLFLKIFSQLHCFRTRPNTRCHESIRTATIQCFLPASELGKSGVGDPLPRNSACHEADPHSHASLDTIWHLRAFLLTINYAFSDYRVLLSCLLFSLTVVPVIHHNAQTPAKTLNPLALIYEGLSCCSTCSL